MTLKGTSQAVCAEEDQAIDMEEHLDRSTPEQQMAILMSWQGVYGAVQAIQEVCAGHVVAEALIYGDEKTTGEDRQIMELLQRRAERIERRKLDAAARATALSGAQHG